MSSIYQYAGQELKLFEGAQNWKAYLAKAIRPYLKGKVLEVGAGIGGSTRMLNNGTCPLWVMLEPDAGLLQQAMQSASVLPSNVQMQNGTIEQVQELFDTILYIDVLEHIEDDKNEMHMAALRLKKGGHLIVLSPAFSFLYSPFDKAIGHYRRYTKHALLSAAPSCLQLKKLIYLDSFGFCTSAANKLLLRQEMPTTNQIHFWDRYLVPLSRWADKMLFHAFGKSILAIWQL